MTVVAAVMILMYGATGDPDVRVATFLARRQRRELEGVVGLFSDVVILRTDLAGDPSCREVLRRVRVTTLEAQAHADIPFSEVVRARSPLSQVLVIWQNAFRLSAELAALPLAFLPMDQAWLAPEAVGTAFDLTFELRQGRSGLTGTCLYNTRVFDGRTVRRLLRELSGVVEAMVTGPDRRVRVILDMRVGRGERPAHPA
jgi:non-ribosomal peptide synthetase component F